MSSTKVSGKMYKSLKPVSQIYAENHRKKKFYAESMINITLVD